MMMISHYRLGQHHHDDRKCCKEAGRHAGGRLRRAGQVAPAGRGKERS